MLDRVHRASMTLSTRGPKALGPHWTRRKDLETSGFRRDTRAPWIGQRVEGRLCAGARGSQASAR